MAYCTRRTVHEPVRRTEYDLLADHNKAKRLVKSHIDVEVSVQIGRGGGRIQVLAAARHQTPADALPPVCRAHGHWTRMPVRIGRVVTRQPASQREIRNTTAGGLPATIMPAKRNLSISAGRQAPGCIMVTPVIVVLDEGLDLAFEVTGQEVVFSSRMRFLSV